MFIHYSLKIHITITLSRPIDFLGIDNDRLAIMCVFGAAAGSIFLLIVDKHKGDNAWATGMNYIIFLLCLQGLGDYRRRLGCKGCIV